jgi:CRISPR-associated endoribonuclease Cas6
MQANGKGFLSGFTGEVSLKVLSRLDPLVANVANLLVQYAQFCSTGTKTRLGMGFTTISSAHNQETLSEFK